MALLRTHSAFTAELTRVVCKERDVPVEYAFLCGLLHDVGIAACILALSEFAQSGPGISLDAAWPAVRELHEWGSEFLAKTWSLPADLTRVLGHHHADAVDPADRLVHSALRVADAVAADVGFGFHSEIGPGEKEAAFAELGIDEAGARKLTKAAEELAEAFRR
jgi:HD-like signal output (HDOD) protein